MNSGQTFRLAQGIQNNFRQKSLLWFSRSGFSLLVGVLLLPVGARYALTLPDDTIAQATQQREATEQEATRAAAERAFQEGVQLYRQGTAESLRQAITKFEEALPLYQAVGDRQSEAFILNAIGYIYSALGDKQKALEFYNQSLPLSRATGDKAGEAADVKRSLINLDHAW